MFCKQQNTPQSSSSPPRAIRAPASCLSLPRDTQSPPHRSQLIRWGYSAGTRQQSSARHTRTWQRACPPVASHHINQLLLHRDTPSSFQIPILTKLVKSSWHVWNLCFPADFGQCWRLCPAFIVQGPGTDSLLSWASLGSIYKTNWKMSIHWCGQSFTSSPLSALPPTRRVWEIQWTHTWIYMIFCPCDRHVTKSNNQETSPS